MSVELTQESAESLGKVAGELEALARASETATGAVAARFEDLAAQADRMLTLGADVIACAQDEKVQAILPRMQPLAVVLQQLIRKRQQAVSEILGTLQAETALLSQLLDVTGRQRAVARETAMLGMLTDIEIAHLGDAGAGFVYLARELESFAQSVTSSTRTLADRVVERETTIQSARDALAREIPRICLELSRVEENLAAVFAELERGLSRLAASPQRFEAGVREIAAQINGVVSAVQTQDITRQQIVHVSASLRTIAEQIRAAGASPAESEVAWPRILAGLSIQAAQLRSVRQTAEGWLSQIGTCLNGILEVGAGEVGSIGPTVLAQEQQLASQLAAIEALEKRCQSGAAQIEATCSGLSRLATLIGEHLEQSLSVRERVRLLMFNSIVEAGRLGTRADAMMEIARSIQRVATAWNEAADRIRAARDEVRRLTAAVDAGWGAFVGAGEDALRQVREETAGSREVLRTVASLVTGKAGEIDTSVRSLQSRREMAGDTIAALAASLVPLGAALDTIEQQQRQLENRHGQPGWSCPPEEAEALFAAAYTTEQERAVLRAALAGAALPVVTAPAATSIELF